MIALNTSRGRVSAYGFACGYLESAEVGPVNVTLWREHGCYHIRAHDFAAHARLSWDCCADLGTARRLYRAAILSARHSMARA